MNDDQAAPAGDELGRRLHSGPLQAFFAGLLLIEAGGDDKEARLVEVLETGAAELREIISELTEL